MKGISDVDIALVSGEILLRALGRFGDPVDIGGAEARQIAQRLVELAGPEGPSEGGEAKHLSAPYLLGADTFPRVYAYLDRGGTILLKAADTIGSPVGLSPAQARHVARELVRLAEAYDHWAPEKPGRL